MSATPSLPSPLPVVATVPAVIPVDLIDENPLNPRKRFVGLVELGKNMQALGQFSESRVRPHPTVAGHYELVDGARRRRACLAVGKLTLNCLVGEFSDAHVMAIALSMGGTQEALTDWEQAEGFDAAIKMAGATQESVSAATGFSQEHISARLCLLRAPAKTRGMLQEGVIGSTLAYIIARIPGDQVRKRAEDAILPASDGSGALSVRAARELVKERFSRTLTGAAFDAEDAALVPDAGPCRTCMHRAGGNAAIYGDVDNPNTCMMPACFLAKEAAARLAKVAAQQAEAGAGEVERVALSAEENAKVFPVGAREPAAESGYIAFSRPMPEDLLKPEVAAAGAPKVCDVIAGVRVHVGTDDMGRAVEVVRVAEAVLGVVEPAILRKEVLQKYGMGAVPAAPRGAPVAGSLAAEGADAKKKRAAAERALGKRKRAAGDFLRKLYDALCLMVPAKGEHALWSLAYEHHLELLEEGEAAVLVPPICGEAPEKGGAKAMLKTFAAELRGVGELRALVLCMMWAPSVMVADRGLEEAWVVDIHKALIAVGPGGAGIQDAPSPAHLTDGERAGLTQIAAAHLAGMSAHKIAREFDLPLREVCGMLQLDAEAETLAREELYDKVLEVWGGLGVALAARPASMKMALGRVVEEEHLVPEELRKILEQLSQAMGARAPKPVEPGLTDNRDGKRDE